MTRSIFLCLATCLLLTFSVDGYVVSENTEGVGSIIPVISYPFCDVGKGYDSYEFHAALNASQFCGYSNIAILFQRVIAISNDIVATSAESLEFVLNTEYIHHEVTKYLTKSDGAPFPEDKIEDPVYTGSCGVRVRETTLVAMHAIQDTTNTTSLVMNGVTAATFPKPEDVPGTVECNVYPDGVNVAYTSQIPVSERPTYSTFGEVSDVFDFAGDFFELPSDFSLPLRSDLYTSFFSTNETTFLDIPTNCVIELEFEDGNFDDTLWGKGVTGGEVACKIFVSDIEEADADVEETLKALQELFIAFRAESIWAEQDL